jgi:hypothetical protein
MSVQTQHRKHNLHHVQRYEAAGREPLADGYLTRPLFQQIVTRIERLA